MAVSPEFLLYLKDALAPLGAVDSRRMFGGAGLFLDGLMFAIVIDDQLWLKTDEANRPDFGARGLPAFTYLRQGREVALNFHHAPEDALDMPDELVRWCRGAYACALRNVRRK